MKTTAKSGVQPKAEGQAQPVTVAVQPDLAERTLAKLQSLYTNWDIENPSEAHEQALTALRQAFAEAHCHHTLHDVRFWDLGANSRIIAGNTTIPYPSLPAIGSVIEWQGQTYYIASLKEPE